MMETKEVHVYKYLPTQGQATYWERQQVVFKITHATWETVISKNILAAFKNIRAYAKRTQSSKKNGKLKDPQLKVW